MKISQVAAQLYTLRDFCKTSEDLTKTAKKVRDIGYQSVQVSGVGPIAPEEIRKIMGDAGLVICASHERGNIIREQTETAIKNAKDLGTTHVAYPFPGGVNFSKSEDIHSLIADLTKAGRLFKEAGLVLSYHNHGTEFINFEGKPLLEKLRIEIPSDALSFELDTYWVQYGGGNPTDWCRRMSGRLPCIHLKDYGFSAETGAPQFREIGNGNLDFKSIIPAAEESGCEWFIVEQDTCPGDPFDSLKISFDFIKNNLVG